MRDDGATISVRLAVSDLGATEAFYGGILALPVKRGFALRGAPKQLVIGLDGWELVFVEERALVLAHPLLGKGLAAYPKGIGVTLRFRVEEIEDISDALKEEGMEIFYPLEEKPYGFKELWCFDPDGYLLVLEEPWR